MKIINVPAPRRRWRTPRRWRRLDDPATLALAPTVEAAARRVGRPADARQWPAPRLHGGAAGARAAAAGRSGRGARRLRRAGRALPLGGQLMSLFIMLNAGLREPEIHRVDAESGSTVRL